MLTLTPKQNVAWQDHLERPDLRRHLFYGGARSGKTDVILTWLCLQAAKYPGARILMARRTQIAAAKSLWSDSLVKMLRGRSDFKMLESGTVIRCRGVVAYGDTSFLFSLYGNDANSAQARTIGDALKVPLAFTPLHRHELRNAFRLAIKVGMKVKP